MCIRDSPYTSLPVRSTEKLDGGVSGWSSLKLRTLWLGCRILHGYFTLWYNCSVFRPCKTDFWIMVQKEARHLHGRPLSEIHGDMFSLSLWTRRDQDWKLDKAAAIGVRPNLASHQIGGDQETLRLCRTCSKECRSNSCAGSCIKLTNQELCRGYMSNNISLK